MNSLFKYIRQDLLSGLIVFLIALPLCLGIAQAAHAPLFAGVVAGIVGGIVVGSLSGSPLSVAGPAAGLTAIVFVAIQDIGSFPMFLCAVIIAGAIQLLLGVLKAGGFAGYFPSSVIEGMLAGIGLTIIIKQVPDAVGFAKTVTATMSDAEDGFRFGFIGEALQHIHPGAVMISAIGLGILIFWQTTPMKKLQIIPAGLLVVIAGTVINELFIRQGSTLNLDSSKLVSLPVANSPGAFFSQFMLPDINGFLNPKVWQAGLVLAAVASIETLLCIEATDKLDPHKRYTPTDRELKAQGIGNILSGLLGGLPITSVIVRSSANINAGARSRLSTILHGLLLLLCAASIPFILNMIPKAALAAILIFTGYKLCNPKVFRHMWKDGGATQFIPFVATAAAVVSLDLLKGVSIGLIISIFYILRQNLRIPFYFHRSSYSNGELIKITLAQEVSFLNKTSIRETLDKLPENSSVIIDAANTEYIDFDVLDIIREFHDTKAPEKNIKISLMGFRNVYKINPTMTEEDIVSQMMNMSGTPKRSAGNYKKLLRQLTATGNK